MKLARNVFLGSLLALSAAACSPVQPWQRGVLAKPHMALEPYPLQNAFRDHDYRSREAALGSGSHGGGGCGCY
ncbi:DUF4266 domain-containing protein [Candidatus Methylocalor cossyra]